MAYCVISFEYGTKASFLKSSHNFLDYEQSLSTQRYLRKKQASEREIACRVET